MEVVFIVEAVYFSVEFKHVVVVKPRGAPPFGISNQHNYNMNIKQIMR